MTPQKHLLIVDDYPDALDIWAFYLRAMGYRVSTASDGASAIAEAERLLPDLIVLDLELPQVSGFDVAQRLRDNPDTHDIPLIAATGYSQASQVERAHAAGFDRVLLKPCDPDFLLLEIERLLASNPAMLPLSSSDVVEHGHNNG